MIVNSILSSIDRLCELTGKVALLLLEKLSTVVTAPCIVLEEFGLVSAKLTAIHSVV